MGGELEHRLAMVRTSWQPHPWRSRTDAWFAWRPVRLGALGTGRCVWLRWLWRNRCCGVTIYQRSL